MNLIADKLFCNYLIAINLISAIFFAYDKWAATKNYRRIPELNLHLFELMGGAFVNLLLMYLLRHKNRKNGYYWVTWAIVTTFAFVFYSLTNHKV